MPCKKIVVKGIVQGVFFRESAKRKADELGITGTAKNNPDGSVEIIACSLDEESLESFIEWCRKGPKYANVNSIHVENYVQNDVFISFKVIRN